jgi:PAS domain S-box-containing protein
VHFERERLSSITLNIGEGVCAIAADGKLTFVNRAAADMIELPSLDITIDDPVSDGAPSAPGFLLTPAREAMRTGRTVREDDARFRGKGGGTVPVAYTASAVLSDGRPSGAVIAFRDITERKAFEDELHHHACYDSLTGLANRRLLVERLDQALRRSALDRKTHALIFVEHQPIPPAVPGKRAAVPGRRGPRWQRPDLGTAHLRDHRDHGDGGPGRRP